MESVVEEIETETPVEEVETPIVPEHTDNEDGRPGMIFFVSTKVEKREYTSRDEAVEAAKTWSKEEHASVSVEREDARVKMTFRDGGLVDYVFETRKGRKA